MTLAILDRSRRPAFSVWLGRFSPSIPDRWRPLVLTAASVVVGGIGWSGHVLALPLAMLFPALWAASLSRTTAAAVAAGYFLGSSRGLPQGIANYFSSSVWAGILLWLIASLSFVVVHAGLWTARPGGGRVIRYGIAAVLMAIPPFGIVGWAHPITAAGVLLPGWGWWGLAAIAMGLVAMTTRAWPAMVLLGLGAWGGSAAHWTPPSTPSGWVGVNTQLGAGLGQGSALDQHSFLARLVGDHASTGARVVVLPESTLGVLTPTIERFWTDTLADLDIILVAGAVGVDRWGYDNVMVTIGAGTISVPYRERMPVPVSMWQPWRIWLGETGGARATFFADPVIEIAGRRIAPLICYEQLLVWPVLQSVLHRPDTIVGIANGWWATGTSIPTIQRAAIEAWASLFGLSVVTAFNQ